jgi:predicted dehydrogenase
MTVAARRLRVGIAGAGHFGRYHALKVASADRALLAGIYDPDEERAKTVGWEAGAPAVPLGALLADCDALIVAAPAEAHHDLALQALDLGKHVLVEKPIASTLPQADALGRRAAERGVVLQVGHLERFSAAFTAVAGRMRRPLYIEATRIAPFKPRGTDVSVILDLMIHDLDLILLLVDSPLESVDAVGAAVASAHEDIANARVRFENGSVATITASRISFRTERRMRVFAQDGYLAVDFANRRLTSIARATGRPIPQVPEFGMEDGSWDDHDSLAAEHAAFYASALDGAPVVVDAAAGRRALEAALAVMDAMAASRDRARASGLIR